MKNREYIINKIQFINNIYRFIDYYLSNTKFLFLKILFPIEEYQSTLSNTKLIIEIIYEIGLEFYIEYIKAPQKNYLDCFEGLICNILNVRNFSKYCNQNILYELNNKKKKKNVQSYFLLYIGQNIF